MKNILYFLFILSFVSCSTYSGKNSNATQNSKEYSEYFFIQTADNASVIYDEKNKIYKMTLNQTNPYVTYLSNAPQRITGLITIDRFVYLYQIHNLHSLNSLNAELVSLSDQESVRIAVTLHNLDYNPKSKTLTYRVNLVLNKGINVIPYKIHLKNVALFIDDGCGSCGGSGF